MTRWQRKARSSLLSGLPRAGGVDLPRILGRPDRLRQLARALQGGTATGIGIDYNAVVWAECRDFAVLFFERDHRASQVPQGMPGGPLAPLAPGCPLLICCVDVRHLEHCVQCDDFLCGKLEAFARDCQAHHLEAVERWKGIAESQQQSRTPMERIIAYCGLVCSECDAYVAT